MVEEKEQCPQCTGGAEEEGEQPAGRKDWERVGIRVLAVKPELQQADVEEGGALQLDEPGTIHSLLDASP